MGRLKERDKRPTRKFQPGDLVTPHPKRSDLIAVGDGIVISVSERQYGTGTNAGQTIQDCLVFFAAREVDLWSECRRWARESYCAPHDRPEGITIPGGDLVYAGRSEPEWLDPPDMDEISLARFGDILE
jgi:hypothetical protein